MVLIALSLFVLFLLWGSFLNVVAYRLIAGISIISPRSHCITCKKAIAWHDLIPVLSWLLLRGKCQFCKEPISPFYPFIELLTALCMTSLCMTFPAQLIPAYFIFFSALIITIRTDLETLLISRFVTLFLIPLGFLLSAINALPISLFDSFLGAIFGYIFLWMITKIFWLITGKQGMGQGDLELLAFIGSFVGLLGVWATLLLSTVIGSIVGIIYIRIFRLSRSVKIPFGPFLALAAIAVVLFEPYIIWLLAPPLSP